MNKHRLGIDICPPSNQQMWITWWKSCGLLFIDLFGMRWSCKYLHITNSFWPADLVNIGKQKFYYLRVVKDKKTNGYGLRSSPQGPSGFLPWLRNCGHCRETEGCNFSWAQKHLGLCCWLRPVAQRRRKIGQFTLIYFPFFFASPPTLLYLGRGEKKKRRFRLFSFKPIKRTFENLIKLSSLSAPK